MSHARLAPSKSSRVLLCAASPDRESVFPDEDNHASANEGTNAHWLLEQGLAEGAWPPAIVAFGPDKLQKALPYPEFDLPEELIEQARLCYEYAHRRSTDLGAVIQAESKVNPQLYTGRDDSYGTVDVTLIAPAFLEIVDLKTGGMQVEADCPQLKLYALGKMAEHADPLSGLAPFATVRLTVFQPKRPGMDAIERYEDFTQDDLITWATDVWVPAASASDSPNAKATPTEEGCKYCLVQKNGACVEYTASVQRTAATLFRPVDQEDFDPVTDPMQSAFSVDSLTPEQVGLFLEIWPLLKARGKDIEEHATKLMLARTTVPGFKLVKGKGSRHWALDDDDEQAKKFKNIKLTLKQVYAQKLRSPAQMLALSDLTTQKKESIKKHIVHKDGALAIAPVSDKRIDVVPAISFDPINTNPVEPGNAAAPAALPDFLSI